MKFSGELKTCLSADVGCLREAWAKLMRKIKAGVEDAGEYQETMNEAVQLGAEHKNMRRRQRPSLQGSRVVASAGSRASWQAKSEAPCGRGKHIALKGGQASRGGEPR